MKNSKYFLALTIWASLLLFTACGTDSSGEGDPSQNADSLNSEKNEPSVPETASPSEDALVAEIHTLKSKSLEKGLAVAAGDCGLMEQRNEMDNGWVKFTHNVDCGDYGAYGTIAWTQDQQVKLVEKRGRKLDEFEGELQIVSFWERLFLEGEKPVKFLTRTWLDEENAEIPPFQEVNLQEVDSMMLMNFAELQAHFQGAPGISQEYDLVFSEIRDFGFGPMFLFTLAGGLEALLNYDAEMADKKSAKTLAAMMDSPQKYEGKSARIDFQWVKREDQPELPVITGIEFQ